MQSWARKQCNCYKTEQGFLKELPFAWLQFVLIQKALQKSHTAAMIDLLCRGEAKRWADNHRYHIGKQESNQRMINITIHLQLLIDQVLSTGIHQVQFNTLYLSILMHRRLSITKLRQDLPQIPQQLCNKTMLAADHHCRVGRKRSELNRRRLRMKPGRLLLPLLLQSVATSWG